MGGFLRPDLQTLLAQAPNGTPDMPIFEEGAIPPVFGPEFPDPQELVESTIEMPVSEELGPVSIGQPVPPVKASRGERLRKLLGNFLQNFGEGLTAASRAPSGAGFAAGFGAALSAPEERRQQQAREELLRENQKSRQEQAAAIQQIRERQLAIQEQSRLDRQAAINRQGIFRKEERLQRRFQDIIESRKGREKEKRTRTFLKGQQKERLEATATEGKKRRQLTRELAAQRGAAGTKPLTPDQAFRQARLEIDNFVREDSFKTGKDKLFAGEEGIKRFQQLVDERVADLLGRKPTQEEIKQVFDQAKVDSFLADIERAKKADFAEDELRAFVARLAISGEINSTEEERILSQSGLVIETPSQRESFRSKIGRREQIEGSRKTRIPGTTPSFLRKIR